jgi:hypothetical protein
MALALLRAAHWARVWHTRRRRSLRGSSLASSGIATVKTEDGKEHKVKGEGWKVGAKVDCEIKEGKTACKAM